VSAQKRSLWRELKYAIRKIGATASVQRWSLRTTCSMSPRSCALRRAFRLYEKRLQAWVAGGYKGITDTTRILLNHWFYTDHKLPTGAPFKYHRSQQEAIETMVFVWEFEKVRSRKALLERYASDLKDVRLPPLDHFARYCLKMATGSGKTKVMSLAVAWQFFNVARESEEIAKEYAKTFLLHGWLTLQHRCAPLRVEHLFTREQMFHRFGNKKLFCASAYDFNWVFSGCHVAPPGIADIHSEPPFLLRGGCGFCRTLPEFAEGSAGFSLFSESVN
jgi:hypothetical protein